MNEQPNSTQVMSAKAKKIVRQITMYGAVLLLSSCIFWPDIALDRITAYGIALGLMFDCEYIACP